MVSSNFILFVDDEPQTRKMFERFVGSSFNVIVAQDVAEAKQILNSRHQEIGVLITDQRMPGELGVDLLRYMKVEYPNIIRLLTTAYSDLEDAIEAVNMGEIFRYINKPWNADELLIDLRLAMNFFELEQDKTQLLQEKISLSKRQYRVEMLRIMMALANAQTDFLLNYHAIFALLSQLASIDGNNHYHTDEFWAGELDKTKKITKIVQSITYSLNKIDKTSNKLGNKHNFDAYSQIINADLRFNFSVKSIDNAVKSDMSDNNMCALLSLCAEVLGDASLDASTKGEDGLKIILSSNNKDNDMLSQFFNQGNPEGALIGKLIAIFIIAYHFGAQVKIKSDNTILLQIHITFSPNHKLEDLKDDKWIEDVFILHNT